MSESKEETELVTMNIDGQDYELPAGMNLVDAMASVKKEVPHYCYHPKLSVSGNCRMCLVEMGMPMKDRDTGEAILDDAGKQKIGWMPRPGIACNSKVAPGLHVRTNTDLVKDCRESVMEFLLVNHPLDCPICDQAGECRLQEFATDYGRGYSRFIEDKNVKPKRTQLGPRVMLDDERCILCSRCIRFCDEIVDDPVLGFTERGSYSTLTCYPGKQLENNYSLNTVDLCPVGALTSTDFRFKMRVWFLKPVRSICTESSVGVNTEVWSREGKIYRVTPRRNDAVNDTWMSDSGRELYRQVEAETRLKRFGTDGRKACIAEAIERAVELIKVGPVAYVASGHMSVEEQYLLRKVIEIEPGSVHMLRHEKEGDGLLISNDRTPNTRGALVTQLTQTLPDTDFSQLATKLDAGEIQTIVVFGEDLLANGIKAEQLKKINIVYFGTHANATSELARALLPTLTVFEKNGSFINQQFRLQTFLQCIPGPAGLLPDVVLIAKLRAALQGEKAIDPGVNEIWREMSEDLPIFAGLSFANIGETGKLLDSQAFVDLPFCEGKTLHYEPQAQALAGAVKS